ncbi:MAG TPA: DUF1634 domain-containing protein [Ktedonobacteraceae bacterium]|nr:DUF1634 domain-containing protein [Ktedonobacteraceae bacterium]
MQTKERISTQIRDASEQRNPDLYHRAQIHPVDTSRHPDVGMIIGEVLQGGVLVSSVVILLGLLLLLLNPGGAAMQSATFPHTLGQVWAGTLALQPQAIIALGLLLLIATPVVRVAVSILAFAIEHDYLYVAITLVVLAILFTSFLLGKGGA